MAEVRGLQRMLAKLRKTMEKVRRETEVRVTVSYSANYAVHVHENLETFHANGQAKYLEQPLREMLDDGTFTELLNNAVKSGKTIGQGLLIVGLRLQRESQLLVPVDTGNLRNSATTTMEAK